MLTTRPLKLRIGVTSSLVFAYLAPLGKTLLLFALLCTLPIPCFFSYLADQCAQRQSAEDDLSVTSARCGVSMLK
jgi:hypothetical protein